jgi:hypothetical protein
MKNAITTKRGFRLFRNGIVFSPDGKELEDKNKDLYYKYSVKSRQITVYNAFVGEVPEGYKLRRIDTDRGYSVDNIIASVPGNKYASALKFARPYIIKLNWFKEYFTYDYQSKNKIKEETLEFLEAIEEGDPYRMLEEFVDVVIVGLQIVLHVGINIFLDMFNKKMKRTGERIKSGYYNT